MNEILRDKKVIFFDVGYTIDRPASGDWIFTNKFYEITGDKLKKYSPEQIKKARELGMDYLEKNHLICDENEENERFLHYYEVINDTLKLGLSDDDLIMISHDRTYNMDNYIIYPDAKKVIEALSNSHKLGIISDTWPSIENQLRTLEVRQYFSFTTYSFSLGVFKPDKRMFIDALEKCGHDAKESVFIDDCIPNLEGAAEMGITPILIAANPVSDVETSFMKIHSLSELI